MKNVVIAGYARSPFTFATKGEMSRVRPDDLAARVVKALIERTGVKPEDIEDLIVGCAFPEGEQGFNVGRIIGFLTEVLPISVAGVTVNRFCGSSMQSIHMAAGAIQMNAGDAFVCAGVESMSRVPMTGFNPMPNPSLYASFPAAYMSMGETAENLAEKYQITRDEQEAFSIVSQERAAAARSEGRLRDEIVPISHEGVAVTEDGCIRPDTDAQGLAGLKPAFQDDGSDGRVVSRKVPQSSSFVRATGDQPAIVWADRDGIDGLFMPAQDDGSD